MPVHYNDSQTLSLRLAAYRALYFLHWRWTLDMIQEVQDVFLEIPKGHWAAFSRGTDQWNDLFLFLQTSIKLPQVLTLQKQCLVCLVLLFQLQKKVIFKGWYISLQYWRQMCKDASCDCNDTEDGEINYT